jgi:hypothetical protein
MQLWKPTNIRKIFVASIGDVKKLCEFSIVWAGCCADLGTTDNLTQTLWHLFIYHYLGKQYITIFFRF